MRFSFSVFFLLKALFENYFREGVKLLQIYQSSKSKGA